MLGVWVCICIVQSSSSWSIPVSSSPRGHGLYLSRPVLIVIVYTCIVQSSSSWSVPVSSSPRGHGLYLYRPVLVVMVYTCIVQSSSSWSLPVSSSLRRHGLYLYRPILIATYVYEMQSSQQRRRSLFVQYVNHDPFVIIVYQHVAQSSPWSTCACI